LFDGHSSQGILAVLLDGVSIADRAKQTAKLPFHHQGYLDSLIVTLQRSPLREPRPALRSWWYRHIRNLFREEQLAVLWEICMGSIPIMPGVWRIVREMGRY
jgi:hypothetical protein